MQTHGCGVGANDELLRASRAAEPSRHRHRLRSAAELHERRGPRLRSQEVLWIGRLQVRLSLHEHAAPATGHVSDKRRPLAIHGPHAVATTRVAQDT